MLKLFVLCSLIVLVFPVTAAGDCTIVQTEKIGIPLLPDWNGTVTTYCNGSFVKIDNKRDSNFLIGLFAPALNNIPDRLFSLPEKRKWYLYEKDEIYRTASLIRIGRFSCSALRTCDSLSREEGINFKWDISAIGLSQDTVAGIACERMFLTARGVSTGKKSVCCDVSIDIRTATLSDENKPINQTFLLFQDAVGFDPLYHYTLGLALGEKFNAPVESVKEVLQAMKGFPIKVDVKMRLSGIKGFSGTFSYHLDVQEITCEDVPVHVFEVPKNYKSHFASAERRRRR
ncbi:MAG: hypothetical protein KAR42_03345 [candidate division Zixibacteria bacterium]|nr:hypothetical protein [candidate division Zixibacteria bacterium]